MKVKYKKLRKRAVAVPILTAVVLLWACDTNVDRKNPKAKTPKGLTDATNDTHHTSSPIQIGSTIFDMNTSGDMSYPMCQNILAGFDVISPDENMIAMTGGDTPYPVFRRNLYLNALDRVGMPNIDWVTLPDAQRPLAQFNKYRASPGRYVKRSMGEGQDYEIFKGPRDLSFINGELNEFSFEESVARSFEVSIGTPSGDIEYFRLIQRYAVTDTHTIYNTFGPAHMKPFPASHLKSWTSQRSPYFNPLRLNMTLKYDFEEGRAEFMPGQRIIKKGAMEKVVRVIHDKPNKALMFLTAEDFLRNPTKQTYALIVTKLDTDAFMTPESYFQAKKNNEDIYTEHLYGKRNVMCMITLKPETQL